MAETPEYMTKFDEFWRDLVTAPDGSLDLDKVARELHDCSMYMGHLKEVYMHFTDNRISKPNTLPDEVIWVNEEIVQRTYVERDDLRVWLEDGPMTTHGAGSPVFDVCGEIIAEFVPEDASDYAASKEGQ